MAKYSKRTDIKFGKPKPFTGHTKKAMDFAWEYLVPHNAADVVTSFGIGKGVRVVGGITKKGAKHVAKAFRNIG